MVNIYVSVTRYAGQRVRWAREAEAIFLFQAFKIRLLISTPIVGPVLA